MPLKKLTIMVIVIALMAVIMIILARTIFVNNDYGDNDNNYKNDNTITTNVLFPPILRTQQ